VSDKVYYPGQCNNSYIFPGVGLAVVMSQPWKIPEEVFLKAARVRLMSFVSLYISAVWPALNVHSQHKPLDTTLLPRRIITCFT